MMARLLAASMAFISVGAMSDFGQVPTFSVKIEEVRIDVLVTDHGKPVVNLKKDDFEVFDNGVAQEVNYAGFEQTPIYAVLALDMSASVAGERLDRLKSAGQAFLDGIHKDDRAALITFNNVISLRRPLTADSASVKLALDDLKPSGETSIIDGAYAGLELVDSAAGRPLLVIFSDGLDTSSWLARAAVLDRAKRGRTVVYGISGGELRYDKFLRDLTEATGGSLFETKSTSELEAAFLKILEEFRQRYLITYSPRNVAKGGWHRLTVRVKGRRLDIQARPGYGVPDPGHKRQNSTGGRMQPKRAPVAVTMGVRPRGAQVLPG